MSSTAVRASSPKVVAHSIVAASNGSPIKILLIGNDVDGKELTYICTRAPINGTIVVTPGTNGKELTYTPNHGFKGNDLFTYVVNNGTDDSSPQTVTVEVKASATATPPVPPPPTIKLTATPRDVVCVVDSSVKFTVVGTGPSGMWYEVKDKPSHGTVTKDISQKTDANGFTYTPKPGYSGPDSFTYVVNHGTAKSDPATVTIKVTAAATPIPPMVPTPAVTPVGTTTTTTTTKGDRMKIWWKKPGNKLKLWKALPVLLLVVVVLFFLPAMCSGPTPVSEKRSMEIPPLNSPRAPESTMDPFRGRQPATLSESSSSSELTQTLKDGFASMTKTLEGIVGVQNQHGVAIKGLTTGQEELRKDVADIRNKVDNHGARLESIETGKEAAPNSNPLFGSLTIPRDEWKLNLPQPPVVAARPTPRTQPVVREPVPSDDYRSRAYEGGGPVVGWGARSQGSQQVQVVGRYSNGSVAVVNNLPPGMRACGMPGNGHEIAARLRATGSAC